MRSGWQQLMAWVIGILEVTALLLGAGWLLMRPAIFGWYYPAVKESARAPDAARIVRWLSNRESIWTLNPGLKWGQLRRNELDHYEDVRRWLNRVPAALLGVSAAGALGVLMNRRAGMLEAVQWRGLAFLGFLLVFGACFAAWDWKVFFAWIHYPFFGESSWKLSRGAYSLQLFPAQFWRLMGTVWLIAPFVALASAGILLRGAQRRVGGQSAEVF